MDIGAPELIIVLIIVLVIFGVGRIGKLGGELGKSMKEFRQGLADDKDKRETDAAVVVEPAPVAASQAEPDLGSVAAHRA